MVGVEMFAKVNIGSAGHKGSDSRSVSSVYKLAVIRYRTLYHPGKCLYYALEQIYLPFFVGNMRAHYMYVIQGRVI